LLEGKAAADPRVKEPHGLTSVAAHKNRCGRGKVTSLVQTALSLKAVQNQRNDLQAFD
jgi:hypothetical protein